MPKMKTSPGLWPTGPGAYTRLSSGRSCLGANGSRPGEVRWHCPQLATPNKAQYASGSLEGHSHVRLPYPSSISSTRDKSSIAELRASVTDADVSRLATLVSPRSMRADEATRGVSAGISRFCRERKGRAREKRGQPESPIATCTPSTYSPPLRARSTSSRNRSLPAPRGPGSSP